MQINDLRCQASSFRLIHFAFWHSIDILRGRVAMSANGTSRHFAALQNLSAIGLTTDKGLHWAPMARQRLTLSLQENKTAGLQKRAQTLATKKKAPMRLADNQLEDIQSQGAVPSILPRTSQT